MSERGTSPDGRCTHYSRRARLDHDDAVLPPAMNLAPRPTMMLALARALGLGTSLAGASPHLLGQEPDFSGPHRRDRLAPRRPPAVVGPPPCPQWTCDDGRGVGVAEIRGAHRVAAELEQGREHH